MGIQLGMRSFMRAKGLLFILWRSFLMAGYFSKLRDFAYKNPNNQDVIVDLLKIAQKTIRDDVKLGMDYCKQLKDLL